MARVILVVMAMASDTLAEEQHEALLFVFMFVQPFPDATASRSRFFNRTVCAKKPLQDFENHTVSPRRCG